MILVFALRSHLSSTFKQKEFICLFLEFKKSYTILGLEKNDQVDISEHKIQSKTLSDQPLRN